MADPNLRTIDQYLLNALSTYSKTGGGVNSVFGYNYAQGAVDDQSIRARYYPQTGETYEQWLHRIDQDFPGLSDTLGTKTDRNALQFNHDEARGRQQHMIEQAAQLRAAKANGQQLTADQEALISQFDSVTGGLDQFRTAAGFADPNKLGSAEGGAGQAQASGTDLLRQFAEHMMAPLDQNDPYVKSIVQSAAGAAQNDARMRGIGGGYATANVEQNAARAGTNVQLQRNQIGANAMAQAEGINLQQAQLAQQQYQAQYQAQLGQLQAGYQQQLGGAQGTGALIGGIGGAIIGSYGGPAGMQAGIAAGSQLGGGIGGMIGGGSQPYLPYSPPAINGSRNRGGY